MEVLERPRELAVAASRAGLRAAVRAALRRVPPAGEAPMDEDLRRVARLFERSSPHRLPVQVVRAVYRGEGQLWQGPVPEGVHVAHELLTLPADDSGPTRSVRMRTYTPAHGGGAGMVYVHGGGFCIGDLSTHDAMCRRLAAGAGVVIQSVEYRLAPEHPFPASLTDILQAWRLLQERWVAAGGAADRFGIGGDSAGGHAAATVAGEAAQPTLGVEVPRPGFCWMLYPATDTRENAADAMADVLTRGGLLSGPMVKRFTDWHVAPEDVDAPALNPGLLPDEVVAATPRSWVQTVGLDPLRAQGERYAARLAALGVDVTHEHEPTMAHGYISMTGVSAGAASAIARSVTALRRLAHA